MFQRRRRICLFIVPLMKNIRIIIISATKPIFTLSKINLCFFQDFFFSLACCSGEPLAIGHLHGVLDDDPMIVIYLYI